MYDLPVGKSPKGDFEASLDMAELPFEYGAITWRAARSKKALGHQLISGNRVVGWLCSSDDRGEVIAGPSAAATLRRISHERRLRSSASEWTRNQFAAVARRLPQAIIDSRELASFGITGRESSELSARDLTMIVTELALRPTVMGAFAFEDGLLIAEAGELPAAAEQLASESSEGLTGINKLCESLALSSMIRTVLWLEDGVLLLADAGRGVLGMWTTFAADHQALIANAAALVDLIGEAQVAPEVLPKGFLLRTGKSGVDQVITMLRSAITEEVDGYLRTTGPNETHEIILNSGVPVAVRSRCDDIPSAIYAATTPGFESTLIRIERQELPGATAGGLQDFTLTGFMEALASCRTKSETRLSSLRGRLERLWGFEAGLERLDHARAQVKMIEHKSAGEASLKPVENESKVLIPVSRHDKDRAITLEKDLEESQRSVSRLTERLKESSGREDKLKDQLALANDRCDELHERIEGLNQDLDSTSASKRDAEENAEEVNERATRLSKRVSALEHQLSERAAELASALGDSSTRGELLKGVEELSKNEARLSAEVEAHEEKLSALRDEIENDERRSRMLSDQLGALNDRHRVAATDTDDMERRLIRARDELTDLEADAHEVRKMLQGSLSEREEVRTRSDQLRAEMRDLMGERQTLLRELGDLAARRGQTEGELAHLIKRASELSNAHDDAIADIAEAEKIRQRLSEEPLARALMGEEMGIESLGPVLERLEHARTMGYSVVLLDRAVERGLQLIQFTVEEVSRTPRYLLSNEVMDILERQSPHTAGTVRGLTNWSVKQRLENRLAETVTQVVLDLERMLEDYEQAVTMLRRLRQVLEQLGGLGAPTDQVDELLVACNRPEALPFIARNARGLIQVALDEIYIESDQRDAGAAVRLEQTVLVLEELISQIEATGLTGEDPQGPLWDFQKSGKLPWEVPGGAPAVEVAEDAKHELTTSLMGEVDIEVATPISENGSVKEVEDLWQAMPPPDDDPQPEGDLVVKDLVAPSDAVESTGEADQRAWVEEELARIDAQWEHRGREEMDPSSNPMIDEQEFSELEDDLADLEI